MLQVNLAGKGGGGVQIEDAKIPPRKAAEFIASYQKCMHETVYYCSVFIRMLWNIVEEEEWIDILGKAAFSITSCIVQRCIT